MNRFVAIGVDIAIIAMICISLFTNGRLVANGPAPPGASATTDARALSEALARD
ncbi:MAG TPA: hypothetical protein VFB31_16655 [Pseudolabrys sp.]|nr:hypothetical protein [Pseudolabrys sp.]